MATTRLQHEQPRGFLGQNRQKEGRRNRKAKHRLHRKIETDEGKSLGCESQADGRLEI